MIKRKNIESKIKLGKYKSVYENACAITDAPLSVLRQRDVYFNVERGRLKLRTINEKNSELIYYRRPDVCGPKGSDYRRIPVFSKKIVTGVLKKLFGVKGVVDKHRTLFMFNGSRIHLDRVAGLGDFLEIEVVLDRGNRRARIR